jgi:hypothetical protein
MARMSRTCALVVLSMLSLALVPGCGGPTTLAMFQLTCEIEIAHGSSSRGTTRNIEELRAGESTADSAPATRAIA